MHGAYVQIINGGGFFASCPTCGCDPFPNRETREEAEKDAENHRIAMAIYSIAWTGRPQ